MKARTRKRQLLPLQRESSRLGRRGRDARFYGGAKWTRRQQLVLRSRVSIGPMVFNAISNPFTIEIDGLPAGTEVRPTP